MPDRKLSPLVCHVITDLDVGGAEMMLKRLLEVQPQRQQLQVVVSLTGLGKIGKQLQDSGFSVYTLEMRGKLALPVALLQLVRLLRKLQPDVVQTWMYHADLLGGVAARLCGIRRVIWGIHCTKVPIGRPLTYLVMKLSAWLSGHLPAVILCVADAARQNHIRYGYQADSMLVVPNGFQTDGPVAGLHQPRPLLSAFGLKADDKVIGCVGRFHPDKGQDVLLEAAVQVIAQDARVHFVLAGRGCDEHNTQLSAKIAAAGLGAHVLLLGERDDVPTLLPEFDLFCLPSRSEAFPVALGEAMLAGIPCVATNVGDCAAMLDNLFPLVEPGNAAALAQALLTTLERPTAELRQLALQGRQSVIDRYSIAAVAQQYQQLQEDLAGR